MTQTALPAIVRHFARFLGAGDPDAERAAALASLATVEGHVCADLDCDIGWGPWAASVDEAGRAAFRARLPQLAIVGGEQDWTPLVWDGRRLYLRRYWDYEARVAADLSRRSSAAATEGESDALLAAHFPDAGQRHAARIALARRLALISGGPGTGKTHTLARIIKRLQSRKPDLRIALAAPTGKAAARMSEALQAAGVTLASAAKTLHRLLGVRADGGFQHDRDRPLAVDVLVVDEASMIDLSLMSHLLDALPFDARLILLGDRDQLAAVEAGAVFADLCDSQCLADSLALLTTNFRFGASSGIGRLAEGLRRGEADGVVALLKAAGDDLVWTERSDGQALVAAAREGYRDYLVGVARGLDPTALLALFGGFRVLCAHRQEAQAINRALSGDTLRPPLGTPIMVLRNDPLLEVFNGDIGLLLNDPADGRQKVFFPGQTPRWIALNRLPGWTPAWAMTVHKAQGSEFEEVLLVLPATISPVTTRELVYTGVTRAKRRVMLWASEAVLRAAIERRSTRMSGLRERLT
ncbi:exodeoxyribonuclease V subunit alpha [Sulfuricystis multivorans]|uniref:exodeoxyribonuclease V subunit alpha n=1 Tax=Sulfuricystis multivorans TaxID=2211108 RepID=UPI000F8332B1|nr:exodeoxyribonuclease V subunit alpha [Sulfuricystis multivorans]